MSRFFCHEEYSATSPSLVAKMFDSSTGLVEEDRSGIASEVLLTPSGDANERLWDSVAVKASDVPQIAASRALSRMVEPVMIMLYKENYAV